VNTVTEPAVVRMVRVIPAAPERVYRAWLEPDLIRQWFAPSGFRVLRAEVDERVGGRHRIHHTADHADDAAEAPDLGGFESELLELVPGRRIVFRWGFVGPDHVPDPDHESLLTIDLAPTTDGQTELTLVHERLERLGAERPDIASGVTVGWDHALRNLVESVRS
jgi:uncharacterized protein YndB with AHSA1/START domain